MFVMSLAGSARHSDSRYGLVFATINPFNAVMSLQKRPIKVQNLKPLTVSVVFFALSCERIFIETYSIETRFYRSGNILFAGASVHLSARKMYSLGQLKG